MTILPPGTFKVSDYRKPITDKVKREVLKRYQFDHDPALANRPYDTEAGDFIPPQLAPEHIFIKRKAEHAEKTFGRKEGAAKTVTTRGSDVGEAARGRAIRDRERAHYADLARKAGDEAGAAAIMKSAELSSTLIPKLRIPQRAEPWPKGRKLQSRNHFKRRKP